MSDEKKEPESIFSDAEPPEEGALRHDDAAEEEAPAKKSQIGEDDEIVVDTGGIDPYDHSAEEGIKKEHEESMGVAPPDLPESSPLPMNNPAMKHDGVDEVRDMMEQRFQAEFGARKVEVTQKEREAFVRAALHDEEVIFKIPVEGMDAKIDVAIPSDKFTTLAAAACNQWIEKGHLEKESDMQWLLAFQQIHCWCQIRTINGTPTPWSDFWEDKPSTGKIRDFMSDPKNFEPFFEMNAVRWRMIMDAARAAEMKYKICLENWNNRGFFTGAGTA